MATHFTFRLTEDELAIIRANALAAGMSVSDFVRESAKQTMPVKASIGRTWSDRIASPDDYFHIQAPSTFAWTPPVGWTFQIWN